MLPLQVITAVRRIIIAVSTGDHAGALALTRSSRCSEADIARTIADYGQGFVAPPFAPWDILPVTADDDVPRWSVRAPLWSREEGGRSDLELFLTIALIDGAAHVDLDDVRVP